MSVANATPAQLSQLSAYSVMLRGVSSQFLKLMAEMNALNNAWNGNVSGIIGTPANTIISDNTGLAGAVPLTDTQITTITSYYQNVLTSFYDAPHQQVLTLACGPANSL